MKRFLRLISVFILLASFAAPAGAAFALESSLVDEVSSELSSVPEHQSTLEITTPSVPTEPVVQVSAKSVAANQQMDVFSPVVAQLVTTPPAPSLPASPLFITAYKASADRVQIIQLYNNTSSIERLSDWRVTYVADGDEYEIQLGDGWILPRSYVVLGWDGESDLADIVFSFDNAAGPLESITLEKTGYQPIEVIPPTGYNGQLLHRYKSSAGNFTTNTSFSVGAPTVYGGGLYVVPPSPHVEVREILVQPRDCLVGDQANDCYDFIKLRNTSEQPLDLSHYRLRSGFVNTTSSSTNTTYLDMVIAPGETKTLQFDRDGNRVAFSANDGKVWFEDRYGFQMYPLNVPPYVDSDLTSHRGQSWAYDDTSATWRWAIPSPDQVTNRFLLENGKGGAGSSTAILKPCREDQYRSEETNRCRSIAAGANSLKPCKEGQYRNEETNRCRSIASAAASVLKPCADDQFRNPSSGRCKKIASADELADCGEGRERNPATNRCRNVLGATIAKADFAPTQVAASSSAKVGWIIFGLIAVAALGYGIWEWRYEISNLIRRPARRS